MEAKDGKYVYCIADCGEKLRLGDIGIDHCEVYTVPCKDLCAVVHQCSPEAYNSSDQELAKSWVLAHEEVVEDAWRRFNTVIPFTFNTIIKGGDESVEQWLSHDYERLRGLIDKLGGMEEYSVQIFLDSDLLEEISRNKRDIINETEEIERKGQGTTYFYKQKLKKELKNEVEKKVRSLFLEFYDRIRPCVEDIRVEKVKESNESKKMIANFSILVKKEHVDGLKPVLTEINERKGNSVRFSGPWPPYTFTS